VEVLAPGRIRFFNEGLVKRNGLLAASPLVTLLAAGSTARHTNALAVQNHYVLGNWDVYVSGHRDS
jgi:hypothetical protein